jgi:hypothetical protein
MMETTKDPKFTPKGQIKVVQGSISNPNTSSLSLVLVAMSESGIADSPTYQTLGKKWGKAKSDARSWYQEQVSFRPSNIKVSCVQSDVWLVHMLCVKKDGSTDEKALDGCLKKALAEAQSNKGTIHVAASLVEQVPLLGPKLEDIAKHGVSCYFYVEEALKETK